MKFVEHFNYLLFAFEISSSSVSFFSYFLSVLPFYINTYYYFFKFAWGIAFEQDSRVAFCRFLYASVCCHCTHTLTVLETKNYLYCAMLTFAFPRRLVCSQLLFFLNVCLRRKVKSPMK